MRILWENFTSFPSAIPVVRPEPRHITHTAHTHKTHIWNMKKKSKRITASSNAWWSHNIMFLCMATIRNILHAQRTCCRWRWYRAHWFQMHSRTFRINVSLCVCVVSCVLCTDILLQSPEGFCVKWCAHSWMPWHSSQRNNALWPCIFRNEVLFYSSLHFAVLSMSKGKELEKYGRDYCV